jgi:2-C-methyl-D-erythritol 4-phosphate cytidylyltransferase
MNPDATNPGRAGLVVVAAGVGHRLGARLHKALVLLDGQPLVEHTLRRLLAVKELDPVVLVGHPDDRAELTRLIARLPRPVTLVDGGARRQDSVEAGLAALGEVEFVLVHDAARLFVPRTALPALMAALGDCDCALLAVPVADTLKAVSGHDHVQRTVSREGLWAAQTPQAFRVSALRELLAEAAHDGRTVTDEAGLFEHAGRAVRIVEGSRINFKITTDEDLAMARALLLHEVDTVEPVGTVGTAEERAGS